MKTSSPKSQTEQDVKAERNPPDRTAAEHMNKSGRHAASHVKGSTGKGAGGGKKQKHGN